MTDVDIRAAVRAEVERAGWTHAELAERAGLPRPRVTEYLAGRRDMTGANLDRLLEALGLELRSKRGGS